MHVNNTNKVQERSHKTCPSLPIEDYTVSITGSGNPALGGTYTLLCAVEGVTGSPTFHWFGPREITTFEPARNLTSILTLSNLTLSDAGEYTCRSTLSGVERVAVVVLMLQSEYPLTLYTRTSPGNTHKLMGFCMEVLILGVIL